MFKKWLKNFTLTALFGVAASGHAMDNQGQLKHILMDIQSYQANFEQTVLNPQGQVIKHMQGTMAIKRPNQFRWDIQSPTQQIMVADGKFLWIYDKDLQQASKQILKKDKAVTPAMILSGTSNGLLNDFYISYVNHWYILTPKITTMVKNVKLYFNQGTLSDMEFQSSVGQISRIHFSHISQNKSLNNKLFAFSVPKGVDVIQIQN